MTKSLSLQAPLYEQLRARLFQEILDGTWPNGSFLPTEAALGQRMSMSRVTVRRALQALKDEGVITAVAGRGTQVTYQNSGHSGTLNLIALVANLENGFFTHFMRLFEPVTEASGALVMLKTDSSGHTFTSGALFERLIRAGIRDMVLWPLTTDLDPTLYGRLRAVGANLVVFDQEMQVPWADVVCLNNAGAMQTLVAALRAQGCRRPVMVTYSDLTTPTSQSRVTAFEQAARAAGMEARVEGLPFAAEADDRVTGTGLLGCAQALIRRLSRSAQPPDGYLGVNGGIGMALAGALRGPAAGKASRGRTGQQLRLPVTCVDQLPGMDGLGMQVIVQPMAEMAEAVFACLRDQHRQGAKWQARVQRLPGRLVVT